jgi:hypothetical protein
MTLFGVGYFDGIRKAKDENGEIVEKEKNIATDGMKSRVQVFGELADPHSDHFFCKLPIWFMPLKLEVSEKTASNSVMLQVNLKKAVEVGIANIDIEKLIGIINRRVSMYYAVFHKKAVQMETEATTKGDDALLKKAKDAMKIAEMFKEFSPEVDKQYIPLIDLVDIESYHYKYAAKYKENKDGDLVVQKSKDGWDVVDFNAFAICKCGYSGFFSKEGKSPKLILSDWSIPDSIFAGFVPYLSTDMETGEVYISLTTSRGSSVYDESTQTYVKDPENATPNPKIRGIRLVKGLKGIVEKYQQSLTGDM